MQKMTFHVVSLPHIKTNDRYWYAHFVPYLYNCCKCLLEMGNQVYLYSAENNEFPCTQHIQILDDAEQLRTLYVTDLLPITHHWEHAAHAINLNNENAAKEIKGRQSKEDMVLLFGAEHTAPLVRTLAPLTCIDMCSFSSQNIAPFKSFTSYAWMHSVYGSTQGMRNASDVDGFHFDAVVPIGADEGKFAFNSSPQDYYLYCNRPIPKFGYPIATSACTEAKRNLITADFDQTTFAFDDYHSLLQNAQAVIMPSQNIDPHGVLAQEAMMCGTPVITSDWGAAAEWVQQGVNGFRCRDYGEYISAIKEVSTINRQEVRQYAEKHFSLQVIKEKHQAFFEQLMQLWTVGFYDLTKSGYTRY